MTENSSSKSQTTSSSSSGGMTEQSFSGMSSETDSEFRERLRKPSEKPSFLNSPEWRELSDMWNEATKEYNQKMTTWWENLPTEQQQWAFYNVCRLIHKGDVEDKRSYRGVLYDTFGWGPEAYVLGMEARYMDIHNLLGDGLEFQEHVSQREIDRINQELNDAAEYDRSQEGLG
jgi:hypothetical protein